MITELLKQAGAECVAVVAEGDGRKVIAPADSVDMYIKKGFFLNEKNAAVVCQLAMCAKGGNSLVFVKGGECPGLPGKTKTISICPTIGAEYKHEPSCERCPGLKKDHA